MDAEGVEPGLGACGGEKVWVVAVAEGEVGQGLKIGVESIQSGY